MRPDSAQPSESASSEALSKSGISALAANEEDIPAGRLRKVRGSRQAAFSVFFAILVTGVLGYGGYWWLVGSHYVSTDDAYVAVTPAQITPLVSAAVAKVLVRDTQQVKAGQILVMLDAQNGRIAVAQARAQLAQVERTVRGAFADGRELAAQVAVRRAQLVTARSNLDEARLDLGRRTALASTGAVSVEELTAARTRMDDSGAALEAARAQLTAARAAQAAQDALVAGASVRTNPQVLSARANLDRALLNLKRTVIRAPVAGVIANLNVQVGQRVQVGDALMSVIPIERAYVDANFKETQLAKVRVGQPVVLRSDLYGGSVIYHGRVTGFAGGTGAAFSLIPAQNATGNWIKVVQRLPVRIQIDGAELRKHPLRVGLSMIATIDIGSTR